MLRASNDSFRSLEMDRSSFSFCLSSGCFLLPGINLGLAIYTIPVTFNLNELFITRWDKRDFGFYCVSLKLRIGRFGADVV